MPNLPTEKSDLRIMAEQLARIVEINVTLNSTLNLDELLQVIISSAAEVLDCESVAILLYDEKRGQLTCVAASGMEPMRLAEIRIPADDSLGGVVFREDKVINVADAHQQPHPTPFLAKEIGIDAVTILGVPMRIQEKPTGVIQAINKRGKAFTGDDADLLTVIASQAAVAIHNARLVQALKDAYTELHAVDKVKTNFLALASHELRTPLGLIIGYATFLQQESPGELSDHAKQVLNAAMRMRTLVDAMTNLDMLRTKDMVIHRLVVPMQQILTSSWNELKKLAESRDMQVTFNMPDKPIPVRCDPQKLSTAFVNILDNAVRFTPEGGRITVGASMQPDNQVLAWVQDSGKGIPQADLKKIFNGFYQIEPHTTRKHGGMGIGLAIASGLVEAHGGKIWAESEGPDRGTTIKVLLPYLGTQSLKELQVSGTD